MTRNESLTSDMEKLTAALRGDDGTDGDILSVDVRKTVDILLQYGGPTVFFRFTFNENKELIEGAYHNSNLFTSPIQLFQDELDEIEPYLEGLV